MLSIEIITYLSQNCLKHSQTIKLTSYLGTQKAQYILYVVGIL